MSKLTFTTTMENNTNFDAVGLPTTKSRREMFIRNYNDLLLKIKESIDISFWLKLISVNFYGKEIQMIATKEIEE